MTTAYENKEPEQILISIKDTGRGIDPLIKDRLFQRFATKSVKGIGLGLYLSKKIIEAQVEEYGPRVIMMMMTTVIVIIIQEEPHLPSAFP